MNHPLYHSILGPAKEKEPRSLPKLTAGADILQFAVFDIDKDGRLDYNEFRFALRALGFDLPKPDTYAFLVRYGAEPLAGWGGGDRERRSGGGGTEEPAPPVWREFGLAAFQGIAGGLVARRDPLDECRRAYRLFDKDGKGIIAFEDLRAMAVQIGQPLDDAQIRRMITEFDSDGKGGVNEEEFIRIMMKSRK